MSAALNRFGTGVGDVPTALTGNANAAREGAARAEENNVTKEILHHPDVGLNPDLQAAEAWFNAQLARARATGRFADFFTITVAVARVLLMHNSSNRAIVLAGVREWANVLRSGKWEENGEPIIVAITGELNDGQHRLTAIIETGIPLTTLIVFGVTRDSRRTVDVGKKRTAGHVLGMAGVKNASLTATALKFLLNLNDGSHLGTHRNSLEIEQALIRHPEILNNFGPADRAGRTFKQSGGLFIALHYMMSRRRPMQAARFFEMLETGFGIIDSAHPVARLRKRLQANLVGKAKLPSLEVAALTIKTWNAFIEGRAVDALRWRAQGDAAEAFPQVRS